MNYYNEWDKYAAQWLRNLIAAGYLPPGDVDERDIRTVKPEELAKYTQCHFFAGIGGWSLALKMAGWPNDRPVWTGSCPCQPFSFAGRAAGVGDERHLWPAFRGLIAECNPPTVFGEQVASSLGRQWLAGVRVDLERMGYAVGGADLCAAGQRALHQRARLWWVADANRVRPQRIWPAAEGPWSWEQLEGLVQAEARLSVPSGKDRALVDGVPSRMGQLRAYGNAIVPQVGAYFVKAYIES